MSTSAGGGVTSDEEENEQNVLLGGVLALMSGVCIALSMVLQRYALCYPSYNVQVLCCTMPRHPIPLTAPTRAEHTRPTRPRALREGSATPTAVLRLRSSAVSTHGQLRHDVIVVA